MGLVGVREYGRGGGVCSTLRRDVLKEKSDIFVERQGGCVGAGGRQEREGKGFRKYCREGEWCTGGGGWVGGSTE